MPNVRTYETGGYAAHITATIQAIRTAIREGQWYWTPSDVAKARKSIDGAWEEFLASHNRHIYQSERVVSVAVFSRKDGGDCDQWAVAFGSLALAGGHMVELGINYRNTPQGPRGYHAFIYIDGRPYDAWNQSHLPHTRLSV